MTRRFALVIGNSEYDDTTLARLKTPEADVEALAAALRDPQIGAFDDVQAMVNQTEAAVRRAISSFYLQKKSDDLLLMYFSGHGVLDSQGRLFLAVKDTQRELLNATSIPASFITDDMDGCRSKRQILILDCCHSGAFAKGTKGDAPAVTKNTFEGNGYGRVVLTASDSTQYALEGDQVIEQASLSLFTHYLLDGLTTGEADLAGDGLVTLDEWYDYAYDRVVSETPDQTPRKWVYNQQGELVIARNPNPKKPEPADLPEELKQAIQSPFVAVRTDAVEELKRLLQGSNLAISQAAYQALQRLASADDSRRIALAAAAALTSFDPLWHLGEGTGPTPSTEVEGEDETARLEQEKALAERQAAERAKVERLAAEKAEAESLARQKAEADRQAAEKAEAEQLKAERAEAEGVAYLPFSCELRPEEIKAGETAEVIIDMAGSDPESFAVEFIDPRDKLVFSPPRTSLNAQPGYNAAVRFQATPSKPPIAGLTASHYPFSVRVTASRGASQTLAGKVVARPALPVWLIPGILGIGFLCLLGVLGLYLTSQANLRRQQAAQTASARETAIAIAVLTSSPSRTPTPTSDLKLINPDVTISPGDVVLVTEPTAPEPVVTQHVVAPLTYTPSPTPATLYTLAFASNRDGNWNIYLLGQNGKQTYLTNDARDDSYPAWSPDGSKILFHSDRAGNFDIYTINPDGSGLKQLTTHSSADTYASWSPDGKQIVFQSKRDGNKQIYVMNADGSNQTRLTHSEVDDQFPSWSPDGKQIIYSSDIKGSLQLYLVNADGSDPRQLTAGSASGQVILGSDPAQSQRGTVSYSFASWSPDGRYIASAYATEDKEDIVYGRINSRGQFDFQGLTGLARETLPRWSPDGKLIYFASNAAGNYDIYRINLVGGDLTQITDERSDEEAPSVNPQILTMPGIEVVPVGG